MIVQVEFLSTPPCRGRPVKFDQLSVGHRVSIHAPVQGATVVSVDNLPIKFVSIHAPVQGATVRPTGRADFHLFLSTPPCRGRQCRRRRFPVAQSVSIHAPVQGATQQCGSGDMTTIVSIHAPVQGATTTRPVTASARAFLSTPPCRGRPVTLKPDAPILRFYPRPRAGGDIGERTLCLQQQRFYPRPRAGGDVLRRIGAPVTKSFLSTPPCRGRHLSIGKPVREADVSIHAPVQGATRQSANPSIIQFSFYPRPRAGGDFEGL